MKIQFRTGASAPKPIKVEQVLSAVESGILSLDADRAAAYADAIPIQAAKQHALARREKLFAVKYGAHDPRVGFVREAQKNNLQLQRQLVVVHAASATPPPKTGASEYVLHGYVRNRLGEPTPNATVALYDAQGRWLRPRSGDPTDKNGYFELHFEPSARSESGTASEKAAPKVEKSMGHAPGAGPLRGERVLRVYTLRVYDANQKLVHKDANPVQLRGGASDYREITIADDEAAGIAVPPEQAKQAPAHVPQKPAASPGKPETKKPTPPAKAKKSPPPAAKKKPGAKKSSGPKQK
jgi:hypothetical protein